MHENREAFAILSPIEISLFELIPENGVVKFKKQKWDAWLMDYLQDFFAAWFLIWLMCCPGIAFLTFVNKAGILAHH